MVNAAGFESLLSTLNVPLADNGRPTQTNALATDSIAIDSGDISLSIDQRGRPRDAQCDIGAFERTVSDSASSSDFFVIPLANGKAVIFDL